ncbi:class I SAM-dependent methyltransferase [Nocardioides marmotae]|uniref:class I SAM-dependent methyltransferase n=1 Tax=Nocardioides marmotae TaxID=2663857 RepID=UPI0012B5FF22|nr:methyltransferase domain-containing protein [Nocardioides marmotae]MBC9732795.1 methyltransferase domain-containing protein [Nocardioides marmotae]MTB83909.1 methyltransferase domain-containing protein [Nocardioides marmotae]
MNPPEDVYTHGHTEAVLRSHRWRTAQNSASYLLPHIGERSRILDVGCGPATISVDLARAATSGSVLGIDRSSAVIDEAEALARGSAVTNLELAVGDVYALDHQAGSFDIVHAHQVLQHLSDPVAALREMGRVCKRGGHVAVRDSDYSGFTWYPAMPELDDWLALYCAVARGNGAEPDAGRHLKSWVRSAGLEVVASTAGTWCFSSPEDVSWWGGLWAERVLSSGMAEQALERGLATTADLERLGRGWRRWSQSPDAWFVVLHGEMLASPS